MTKEDSISHESRTVKEILFDFELLCQEQGFIYTFSFIALSALWVTPEQLGNIDWNERPNHQELSFVLGLIVKHPLSLAFPKSEDVFQDQNNRTLDLLEELHRAHFSATPKSIDSSTLENPIDENTDAEAPEEWITSGREMIEPFFYSAEGANEYQFLTTAEKRYKADTQWIENHIGTDLGSFIKLVEELKTYQQSRLQFLDMEVPLQEFSQQCFDLFSFRPSDIPCDDQDCLQRFGDVFSLRPGRVNGNLDSITGYNAVHSHPIIRVDNDKYYVPLPFYLARSIYESPYYWMVQDDNYRETALQNRGNATEEVAYELLKIPFGRHAYRGVKVRKGGQDATDIDVLVLFGNKAVIVQAKSKKLNVSSRLGNRESIEADFQEAIQSAYDQALLCRRALTESGYELVGKDGKRIFATKALDEVYIMCVTGDHYPVLLVQLRQHLNKAKEDSYPLAASILDLEILSCYLKNPYDYLYYLRRRALYSEQFAAVSELSILGFHLKNKLGPVQGAEWMWIDESLSEAVDVDYLIRKGYWPRTQATEQNFWRWKDKTLDQMIECVKKTGIYRTTDAIFFLLDLAGERIKPILELIERTRKATRVDGEQHGCSAPMDEERRGISFISYPALMDLSELPGIEDHFREYASARKYKAYANEWIALGSIAGSPNLVDMAWYSKEPWQANEELDALARGLKTGKVVNRTGRRLQRKPSRNEPCPCGSGHKYKKCHGE